ncbi:hypothetical protein ACFX13_008858 [Malus domestica]
MSPTPNSANSNLISEAEEREMALSPLILKAVMVIAGMCIGKYIVGPPLYWHFMEGLVVVSHFSSSSSFACPLYIGDCSSHHVLHPHG